MNVPIRLKGQTLSFYYGDELITFERVKREHATGKVLIKVLPDCRVIASAPESADNQQVISAVKKRGRWIYEQLRDFHNLQEHVPTREYVSGETHFYLGKQYLLKVIVAAEEIPSVKLLRGKLEVSVRSKQPEQVKALLMQWYKVRAKEVFAKRLDALLEQTLWVEERPPLRVLAMQTQWGSCSPNGRLTLNLHLIKASRECIDYVILHELCHLVEHNHSERFYRLLNQVMPQWNVIKDGLDNKAQMYLN